MLSLKQPFHKHPTHAVRQNKVNHLLAVFFSLDSETLQFSFRFAPGKIVRFLKYTSSTNKVLHIFVGNQELCFINSYHHSLEKNNLLVLNNTETMF